MKYEPKNNNIELEIKEELFTIDPMRAQAKAGEIKEIIKKSIEGKEKELVDDTILAEMTVAAKKCIDLLLGEGASDRIFDETAGYYDVMDLYFFITENVNKKCKEKNAEHSRK